MLDHTPKINFEIEKEFYALKAACSIASCPANSLFVLFKLSLAITRFPKLARLRYRVTPLESNQHTLHLYRNS